MPDTSAEIVVAEPRFYDGADAEISAQLTAEQAQAEMVSRLAKLDTKAGVHDRALAQLLIRGQCESVDTFLAVGEPGLQVGGFKNVQFPDSVTMRGLWRVKSIFAAADKSASVDLQVTIANFPRGVSFNILAPKTPNLVNAYSMIVDRILHPTEFQEIALALANGAPGDKCVVTFNLERVR